MHGGMYRPSSMDRPGSMAMDRPASMASLHRQGSRASLQVMPERTASRSTGRLSCPSGFPTVSPDSSFRQTPTKRRTQWRQFSDDAGDVATAMAAVEMVLKNKDKGREADDLTSSMEEADRRIAEEFELEAQECQDMVRRDFERERAIAKLRSAMKKCNLKALRKAINHALELDVPEAIISEAWTLWRLENQLRTAIAEADLPAIRKAFEEVEKGQQLATFPQEPPFAYQQCLQYWSDRREAWVDCHVTQVSPDDGKILINLKKKASHWFTLHEQHERFRVADADLAAAAPHVRTYEAKSLLDRADELMEALKSEDVERVQDAMYEAGTEKALQPLMASAEKFMRRVFKVRNEYEAARRSDEAVAWHKAKQSIQAALQAEADRARSGADSKGWDFLESDLLVERLEVLEKSFDQSDVESLEAAIAKLEGEELELPSEVTEQARQALLGIRRRQAELDEAINIGDMEGINASLDLATEHMLPQDLIDKAENVREAADSLSRAISSRNEEQLKRTLWKVEKEFPKLPQVEQATSILAAAGELREALQNDNLSQILGTLELANKACMPEVLLPTDLMSKAESMRDAADALTRAVSSRNEELLKRTLWKVEKEFPKLPQVVAACSVLMSIREFHEALYKDDVREVLKALEPIDKGCIPEVLLLRAEGVEKLASALKSGDARLMEETVRVARSLGVRELLLETVQHEFEAAMLERRAKEEEELRAKQQQVLQDLEKALQGDNVSMRRRSLDMARDCGVPQEQLDKLIAVDRSNTVDAVLDAMRGNNAASIEEALQRAREHGVPEDVLLCLVEEDRERVIESLKAALQSDDFDTVEEAFRLAEGRFPKDSPSEVLQDLEKQRTTKRLTHIFQGNDVAAIEQALRDAEQQGVERFVLEDFSNQLEGLRAKKAAEQKLEEEARRVSEARASLEHVPEDSPGALKAAIAQCEEMGLEAEMVALRHKLEIELGRRMEKAKEERAAHEKLAAEFKNAKEAQDFGGGLLVAQWRAAVAEIAKPLVISEED